MPLSTTRTPPQRSFGRRAGTTPAQPTVSLSAPPAGAPADTVQPAQNRLSETATPAEPVEPEGAGLSTAADTLPRESRAGNLTALGVVLQSLAVMARNPVTFLALVAAVALTEQVAVHFPASFGVPSWLLMPLLTTMACMALYAAAFHTAMSSLKGERVNFDLGLRAMASTPPSAYGTIAVTVSALSLLLILPAIGFAWRWALTAPVAIVEGGDARARSLALAAPHRAQLRMLVWLLAGLSLLRGLLMMALSPQSILMGLMGDWLFPMLLTVLTAVASAVLYRQLTSPAAS